MKNEILAGLDIGSTNIRLVVGQRSHEDENKKIQIIGAISVPSEGINKGIVNSIEDATSAISACLEKAERLIGLPITSVWVGINGPNLRAERSRGVVAVSRSDNEINQDDINRAVEAAQALAVPPNYEILHVVPVKFIVDNQEYIKNPVGMTGVRLEVEALIIQNLANQIKNLTKAIYNASLNIEDVVFSPLALSTTILDNKQKDLGVAIVNLGATTTSLAVYEEGELMHTAVLPIGSNHITADIAIGLRCSIDLAEKIKINHGSAKSEQFSNKDEIDISDLIDQENTIDEVSIISKKYVTEIIEARVEEILEKIDNEFKKIDRSGMLPAGVIFVGGGSKLIDLVEVAKKKLRLPVCLGNNKNASTIIDKANDLEYLNALSLTIWGDQISRLSGQNQENPFNSMMNTVKGRAKKIFSSLIPN